MIEVHRLNGEAFVLNSDLIETISATPDTVVRLLNGHRYILSETPREICEAVVNFRRLAGYSCVVTSTEPDSSEGSY